MQNIVKNAIFIALILALAYCYYQLKKYQDLSSNLQKENIQLKQSQNKKTIVKESKPIVDTKLEKKVKNLEKENKLLKDQIFQLEKEQFLFESNQDKNYKLEENLKFKDDTKDLKDKIDIHENEKKDEDIKISPSVDFDMEKKEIDGLKLKIETKF